MDYIKELVVHENKYKLHKIRSSIYGVQYSIFRAYNSAYLRVEMTHCLLNRH